ncbi:MAG TPA: hypothetical protein VIU61_28695 [Kofleriaceae bacterium]
MRVPGIAIVTFMLLGGSQVARADCATEATELRTRMLRERSSAYTWNSAWIIAYGSVALLQFSFVAAQAKPFSTYDQEYEDSSIVGGTKAALGFLLRTLRPLELYVPEAHPEPCVDVKALRAAVEKAGRRERATFYLTLFGGTAVNLIGGAILWSRHDFGAGALSFATGAPAGPLSGWSQPRWAWRTWSDNRTAWATALAPNTDGGWTFWVAAGF